MVEMTVMVAMLVMVVMEIQIGQQGCGDTSSGAGAHDNIGEAGLLLVVV